jgi:hypothetical protein
VSEEVAMSEIIENSPTYDKKFCGGLMMPTVLRTLHFMHIQIEK